MFHSALSSHFVNLRTDFVLGTYSHSGSIMFKVIYGYTLKSDDPYLKLMLNSLEGIIATGVVGSFWVDYLPALKYVPGGSLVAVSLIRLVCHLQKHGWLNLVQEELL